MTITGDRKSMPSRPSRLTSNEISLLAIEKTVAVQATNSHIRTDAITDALHRQMSVFKTRSHDRVLRTLGDVGRSHVPTRRSQMKLVAGDRSRE